MKEKLEVLKGMKVLLVEDEQDIQEQVVKLFNIMNIEIDTANDGLQGLQKITKNTYDVIISDINMPNLSGIEMADIVRNGNKIYTPIIFLTAQVEYAFYQTAKDIDVKYFIYKPFDLIKFVNVLVEIKQDLL